ncbi:hypothetical protein HYT24_03265 [Candidatus Pacearchaeota archaeon]|nr:hypothetical protein [Candidatus Pacearchaeota archaeon]
MAKKKKQKKPWLAAILNFLIIGLGYIYTGKRIEFGIGLIIAYVVFVTLSWSYEYTWADFVLEVAVGLLFAYDGYKTAEEVNRGK